MRDRLVRALLIPLALGFVALLAMLATPVTNREPTSNPETPANEAQIAGVDAESALPTIAAESGPTLETITRFFVRQPPRASVAAPAPIPTEAPKAAPWIRYLGYADKDGAQVYYFKDTRSTRVIALRMGERKSEWKLIARDKGAFVVTVGSSSFSVPDHY